MKIHNSLLEIADKFDVFFFDAYGVFWNGTEFYNNAKETMQSLRTQGKKVFVISNTTQICDDAIKSYHKKGLEKDVHYDEFVSSGDVANFFLQKGFITPQKYFVYGKPHKMFENTRYIEVKSPNDADFFYIGVPEIDTTEIDPFVADLEEFAKLGLTALNANPDIKAQENGVFVIRQGGIAEKYIDLGGAVIELGKPHFQIYEFAFQKLDESIDKSKILMIGDTLRTDILGASNVGIKSVLCVETGVTANEIVEKNTSLEKMFEKYKVVPDYLIKSVGGK